MWRFISKHKFIFIIFLLYFLLQLHNLTLLPVFNDEAGYLDWGWIETHYPGELYFSLYDAKQPLLMWLFGISQSLLPDPLFAGRLVSVLIGSLALLGIYKIGTSFFTRKTAILASLLYIFIPIFVFYDRQALMESSIAAAGIWSIYYTLRFLYDPTRKYAVIIGVLYGIGFFIKSSILLFIFSNALITLLFLLKSKNKGKIFRLSFLIFLAVLTTDFLLLINPQFWQTLHLNGRFTLSFKEILGFPLLNWWKNILTNLEIIFFYITPIVFLSSILGAIIVMRRKEQKQKLILLSLLLPILLQTLMARFLSQRYLVSYLPVITIFAALPLQLIHKNNFMKILISALLIVAPLAVALIQIINPLMYFSLMDSVTRYSDKGVYVSNVTSGYGLDEVIAKLKSFNKDKVLVGTAINTGNPEGGLRALTVKDPTIKVTYIDSRLFKNTLQGVDCLTADIPVYFVSREDQQAGLEKFFYNITFVKNPHGNNRIGIYKLKENCSGKSQKIRIMNLKD